MGFLPVWSTQWTELLRAFKAGDMLAISSSVTFCVLIAMWLWNMPLQKNDF